MKIQLTLLFLVFFQISITAQTKIWLDTDIMIGMQDDEAREVDDGIALIMALKQPQIEIAGISNITYVDYGYDVIHKILNWQAPKKNISVFKGSPHANDLGTENDATRAMYNSLKKEKLSILALGPLTNIATLVKNHPDIIPQIDSIVICAARTPALPFNPGLGKLNVYDYNYEMDTASMNVLLESSVHLVFSGYQPSSYTFIGNIDLQCLIDGGEADQWLYKTLQPWMELNESLFGVHGFIPYDCATLGVISHPEYFSYYEDIPIQVNYRKNDAQYFQPNQKEKPFLEVSYDFVAPKKVRYARRALHGFEELILESICE
ncbi:MAG: nucleoside hydrolase [Chitinophagales bacterium]